MTIRATEALFLRFAADMDRKAKNHPHDSHMAGWYSGQADAYRFVAKNLWNCLAGNTDEPQTPGSAGFCEHCAADEPGCVVCNSELIAH